jgi:2-methylcitrate dehydratase PrpD
MDKSAKNLTFIFDRNDSNWTRIDTENADKTNLYSEEIFMDPYEFIHQLIWQDLPETVRGQTRRCLLDTLGAAIAGRKTEMSQITHDFAALAFGGSGAWLWQDGRQVSPPGAALANAMTIDSFDIHDGHKLVKGHAGAAVIPALFATLGLGAGEIVSGQELLTSLVVGYETALRAGIALHATACDFHTSGAWNALGCAAVTSRRLHLNPGQTREALGIAEYHGPRSQMMRDIEFPTMVKDGSGWGAMAGVSAALLAAGGFTGAPAVTVEGTDVTETWSDLGSCWRILETYFKPYAVCRWAQPAIVAALSLMKDHHLDVRLITRIRVHSFYEATCLACRRPQNTEEAQYSLPFPLAAALYHGRLGVEELIGENLHDPAVLALSDSIELINDPALSAQFPARRFARVELHTQAGEVFTSKETEPNWEPTDPPSDAELLEKFRWLAATRFSPPEIQALESSLWNCAELPDSKMLVKLLQ